MNSSIATLAPTHPRRSNTKSLTEIKSTPVILVCIYNRENTLITHDLLYQLFSPHGQVLKILIFEKINVWKAFIEFSTAQAASEAKRSLDDTVILEDGSKVSIYFSNLKTIKFQNNNTGGKAYPKKHKEPEPFDFEALEANYNESFPSFVRPEVVTRDVGEFSSNPQVSGNGTQNQANFQESEQKEDEILNIVNSLEEKLISDDEDSKPDFDDLEKDDLCSFITNAFQQRRNQEPRDPKAKPSIIDETNEYDIPFESLSKVFDGSSSRFPSIQDFGHPRSQEFLKPFSLSKCSTLSEIPDQPHAIRHPLSRMTSLEEVVMQPRGLQRHKTSIELNVPSQNPFGHSDSYFKFPTMFQQTLTKHGSSQELEFFEHNISHGNGHKKHEHQSLKGTSKIRSYYPAEKSDENNPSLMNTNLGMKKDSSMNSFENYEEKKSQVLYVKGLHHKDIKVHMIYNVFSNFGNLLRIILIKNKAVALLEFENEEYSTVAKEYLNNIVFMGSAIRICYSNYSAINLSNKRSSTEAEEVFRGSPKTFRFKKNGNVSINPPSSTLHLSNLTREACNESLIRAYFKQYARIESLRFLHVENVKNMCLLKLASLEESVNALAHLHDTNFCGRNIQISFSRSKI